MFTGHDEEDADFFWMHDWRLLSTVDMVNWQDHGSPLSLFDFKWADDRAWAPQVIERNGKFYFYVPVHSKISNGMAIGVAVADNIEGPYHDALGKPLYEDGKWDHIDPTVWIDDDGQAYIAWGNPKYYSAKLSDDMIHLASEVKCDTTVKRYTEGPWLYKQRSLSKQEIKQMKHTSRFVSRTGDTRKELLARSRYLLFKSANNWSARQRQRAAILFEEYPDIKTVYMDCAILCA